MINRGKEFKNKMKVVTVVLITLLLSMDLLPVYGYQPVYYEEETYKEEYNWKDELPEEFPTEDLYENVLLVGKLQVGEEGVLNDENELTTRFDEENESLSYAGRFLRFVLQNAENENVPNLKEDETLDEYHKRLKEEFSLLIRDEEDIKPGMIVLLNLDAEEDIDHIGILEEIISPSDEDIPSEEDDIDHEYEAERLANTLGHDVYRIIVPDFNNKVERILMDSEEADRFVEWILLEEREEKQEEETRKATMMKAPLRGNNDTSDTLVADDLSVIVSGISDAKWTGESLDAEINVSRSSAETNDVYRIYFEVSDITTDANGKQIESAFVVPTISVGGRNMTPGQSYYLNEEARLNPFSFHKAEGYDNLYYLEIPEPEFGSTFKTDMKVLYPTPNTHGGNVKMWVTEHPASQSSVPEKIDPADDHYVNSTWKTARIEYYPTKQLQDNRTPSIAYNSGKEAYYVTDLDYMFVMHAQEPDNVPPNGLGEDFTDFLYFEDTIQLPNDMEWDPEVLNYLRTSGEIFQTTNTRILVLGYRDENYNRKYVTWIHSSFTMQQPYFRVDGDNVVIGWQYENPAVGPIDLSRFNRIGSYAAEVMNLDFEDDVIRIKQNPSEPVVVGKEYTINNKIDSTDSFMHVEDENNTDIFPVTVVVKPGELVFEKHHKNGNSTFSLLKYGDPLPYPFTITAKNKGTFALPANSITDTLPNMYYLTPANIVTMFDESDDTSTVLEKEGGGTELTITITNAKICDDIENHNVTTADGDTAVAKPQYNSDGNTYLPGQTVDPCELTDQGTITFVRNGNKVEITRAAFGSTPAQTVSVDITASAIENALREMGFIIGPETTYAFEWMIPGGIINGGESYVRKIPANVKDSFMLLDGDERHYAQASISSTNIANLTGDNPKTATDTTITATREWEIHKDATVDGLNITGPDMLTPGTVVDYQLKITRSGFGTDYEALPLTDEIRGAQILLAIANDKNAHLETEHPGIEKKTINDVEYYMLDQVGHVYKNVWFEGQLSQYGVNSSVDLCADSVTVTSATDNKGNVTLIQWYLDTSDYGNRQYDLAALYKVFIDPERTEYDNTEGNVELDNTGFLGDHQTERIYDDTEYEIPRLGANKEIVTQKGATHLDDSLATHTSIREGEEVTYRLTITKIGDTPLELTQDDFWDALPETVSGSNWIKGVNVLSIQLPEQDGVTVLQGDIENDWDISQTPPGGRTEDPSDDTKQYIVWDNVRIRLTKEAFIYVTVKYPEGNDWDALVLKYGSDPLINTFHVQEHQSSVQHNIYNETKAELFKSVADTGTFSGYTPRKNNVGTGRINYSNSINGRFGGSWNRYANPATYYQYYNSYFSGAGYAVYEVSLYNDGGTRIYLNEFQDTLPRGFHLIGGVSVENHDFRFVLNDYSDSKIANLYEWSSNGSALGISTLEDPDNENVVGKIVGVHAVMDDTTNGRHITFRVDNTLPTEVDGRTEGNLSYDSQRGKFYLNPGEMISFAYWCVIDDATRTDDIATNTIAMPFDDYYGTGVNVDKNVHQVSDDYHENKNDGDAGLMSHSDIENNPNYQVTGSTPETQWLTSEVTLERDPVAPGISKKLRSRTTQGGSTLSGETDLQKATYTDQLNWEITVYNESKTTPLTDYVISDIIDPPYVPIGNVYYSKLGDNLMSFNTWNDDYTAVECTFGSGWAATTATLRTDGSVHNFYTYASAYYQASLTRLDDGRLRFDLRMSPSFYNSNYLGYASEDLSIAPNDYEYLRLSTINPTTNYNYQNVYNEAFITPVIQQDFDKDGVKHGTIVKDTTGIYPGVWYGRTANYGPSVLDRSVRNAVEAMAIVPIDQDAATRSIKTVTEKGNPTNTVSSSIEALWIELPDADTVVTYTNEVTNLLENDIPKFIMIDSLPDVSNDHYSFDTGHKRYSAFSVNFAVDPNFVLTITDENNVTRTLDPSEYTVEYSDNTEFTDNDWDGTSATHWTSTKKPTSRSFRIIINNTSAPYIISRHSKLIVSYDAIIDTNSFDESVGNIAWNSFGYRYKPINAEAALQSTPLKVGIKTRGPQKTFVKELVTYDVETNKYEPIVYTDPTGENNPLKYQFVVTKSRITVDKNSVDVRADFISELQELIDNSGTFGFFEVAIDSGSSRSNEITFGEVENGLLNEQIVSGDGNPWVWEDNTQYYIYEIPHLNSKIVDVTVSDATTTESVLEDPSRIGINTHPFVRGAKFTYKDAKDLIFKASNEDTWSLVVEKKNDDSTKSLNGAVYGLYSLNPDDKVSTAKYEEYTTLVHTFDEEYTIPQTVVGSDDKTYYLMSIKVTGSNIDSSQSYKQGFIDFEGLTLETYLLKELIAPKGYKIIGTGSHAGETIIERSTEDTVKFYRIVPPTNPDDPIEDITINNPSEDRYGVTSTLENKLAVGSFRVQKTVSDNNQEAEFKFTVKIYENEQKNTEGIVNVDFDGVYGDLTFTDGVASFTIKHGEEVVAEKIPAEYIYTIEEKRDYNPDYAIKSVTGGTYDPTTGIISGKVEDNVLHTIVVNNGLVEYVGDIIINKTVKDSEGNVISGDTTDFTFEVTLKDENGMALTGNKSFTTIKLPGNVTGTLNTTNGVGTVTLKHGEKIVIKDIPAHYQYTIKEINVPTGYSSSTGPQSGVVPQTREYTGDNSNNAPNPNIINDPNNNSNDNTNAVNPNNRNLFNMMADGLRSLFGMNDTQNLNNNTAPLRGPLRSTARNLGDYITSSSLTINGVTVTDGGTIEAKYGDDFTFEINWKFLNSEIQLENGDTFVGQLPNVFHAFDPHDGIIYNGSVEVGNYHIDDDGNITITYTNVAGIGGSNVTGEIRIGGKLDVTNDITNTETTRTFEFEQFDYMIDITPDPTKQEMQVVKSAAIKPDGGDETSTERYFVIIIQANGEANHVNLWDEMGAYLNLNGSVTATYTPSIIYYDDEQIKESTWGQSKLWNDAVNAESVPSSWYTLDGPTADNPFAIHFDNMPAGTYYFRYKVDYDYDSALYNSGNEGNIHEDRRANEVYIDSDEYPDLYARSVVGIGKKWILKSASRIGDTITWTVAVNLENANYPANVLGLYFADLLGAGQEYVPGTLTLRIDRTGRTYELDDSVWQRIVNRTFIIDNTLRDKEGNLVFTNPSTDGYGIHTFQYQTRITDSSLTSVVNYAGIGPIPTDDELNYDGHTVSISDVYIEKAESMNTDLVGKVEWRLMLRGIEETFAEHPIEVIDTLPTGHEFVPDSIYVTDGESDIEAWWAPQINNNIGNYITWEDLGPNAEGRQQIKFTFNTDFLSIITRAYPSGPYDAQAQVLYQTKITDQAPATNTYSNDFDATHEGSDPISGSATAEHHNKPFIYKGGDYTENTAPYVHYTIYLNPEEYSKEAISIGIIDELGSVLSLEMGSIRVWEVGKLEKIDEAPGYKEAEDSVNTEYTGFSYSYDFDNRKIYITNLPTNKALKIEYRVLVELAYGEDLTPENSSNHVTATITEYDQSQSEYTITGKALEPYGQTSGSSVSIRVYKYDSNDNTVPLSNALFRLEELNVNHSNYTVTGVKSTTEKTSGNDGYIMFSELRHDTVYRVTEREAPDGFTKTDATYYVVFEGHDQHEWETVSLKDEGGNVVDLQVRTEQFNISDLYVGNDANEIEFVNIKQFGGFTLKKKLTGNAVETSDASKLFNFRITAYKNTIQQQANNIDTTINGTYGDVRFVNGVATVQVSSVTAIKVENLPIGEAYTIEEIDTDPSFHHVGVNGEDVVKGVVQGKAEDYIIEYANDKTEIEEPIELNKKVDGIIAAERFFKTIEEGTTPTHMQLPALDDTWSQEIKDKYEAVLEKAVDGHIFDKDTGDLIGTGKVVKVSDWDTSLNEINPIPLLIDYKYGEIKNNQYEGYFEFTLYAKGVEWKVTVDQEEYVVKEDQDGVQYYIKDNKYYDPKTNEELTEGEDVNPDENDAKADKPLETVRNKEDGSIQFSSIKYTYEDDGKTFEYYVKETYSKPDLELTMDDAIYYIKDVVSYVEQDNKLEVTRTYQKKDSEDDELEDVTAAQLLFDNLSNGELVIKKVLTGNDKEVDREFQINLVIKDEDGNPITPSTMGDATPKITIVNTVGTAPDNVIQEETDLYIDSNGKAWMRTYEGTTPVDKQILLKGDYEAIITGLRTGWKYEVSEEDYTSEGYLTTLPKEAIGIISNNTASRVEVFNSRNSVKLHKVDSITKETLVGAEFALKKLVVAYREITDTEIGTYYKLKSGYYTTTPPTIDTYTDYEEGSWDETQELPFAPTYVVDEENTVEKPMVVTQMDTDIYRISNTIATGTENVFVMSEGGAQLMLPAELVNELVDLDTVITYKLYETVAPVGYFLESNPWTIEIKRHTPDGSIGETHVVGHWDITVKDPRGNVIEQNTFTEEQKQDPDYEDDLQWENYHDMGNLVMYELPSSGGMGTYIHTILGTMCITLGIFYILRNKKLRRV